MDFYSDWEVVLGLPGREMLLSGLWVTLQLAFYAIILSTIIGMLVALGRVTREKKLAPLRWLLTAYVEFFRNVPLVVQLVFWGFAVFSLPAVQMLFKPLNGVYPNAFIAGVLGLAVYTSTYIAEVFRSGLQSIPKGQMEAARASGLGYWQTMLLVIIPQVIRGTIGPLGNQYIGATKNTSLVLFLGVSDLVFQAQQIEAITFKGIQAFSAVAAIFAVICLTEALILSLVEGRLSLSSPGNRREPKVPTITSVIRSQA